MIFKVNENKKNSIVNEFGKNRKSVKLLKILERIFLFVFLIINILAYIVYTKLFGDTPSINIIFFFTLSLGILGYPVSRFTRSRVEKLFIDDKGGEVLKLENTNLNYEFDLVNTLGIHMEMDIDLKDVDYVEINYPFVRFHGTFEVNNQESHRIQICDYFNPSLIETLKGIEELKIVEK